MIGLATGADHLIHDAAVDTDILVFSPLAQQCQLWKRKGKITELLPGIPEGDLDRGRR